MRLFLLSLILLTACFSFAESNVIQEPKPKYAADIAKEEKKLSKKEKAKLKKWRAPRKGDSKNKKTTDVEKTIEEQIKDEDSSDLTPPESL